MTLLVNVAAHSISYPYFPHELICNALNICGGLGANVLKTCFPFFFGLLFFSHIDSWYFSCLEVLHSSMCILPSLHISTHSLCARLRLYILPVWSLAESLLHSLCLCAAGNVIRGRSDFPVIATRIVSTPLSHFTNLSRNWVSPAIRSITTLILEFNVP